MGVVTISRNGSGQLTQGGAGMTVSRRKDRHKIKPVSVRFPAELLAEVDKWVDDRGVTRNGLIVRAVEAWIEGEEV